MTLGQATRHAHQDLRASLWAATAIAAPPAPALRANTRADIAVVGAGYTGLSAALHAAERGAKVVVLEAKEPGWGASGRNGGQVIAGIKIDPDAMDASFGRERGAIVRNLSGGAPDTLFALIKRHAIDCEANQSGWIQPAYGQAGLRAVEARAAEWARHGVAVRLLDRSQVGELVGTDAYAGGWLDPRGGSVQPLSLARGLAKAAQTLGAAIHGDTRVIGIARDGASWVLTTAQGATLAAPQVILATNGYTDDLWPGLRRSIIPVRPFQVASAPLGENVRRTIYPQGHVGSDTKRMLSYYRLDSTGRLLMGGRGSVGHGRRAVIHAQLRADVKRFFPHLGELRWDYAWSGWVALTKDHVPHIHELAPGVHAGLGYQGRGLALGVVFGRELARRALEAKVEDGWPLAPMEPLPFHAWRKPVLHGIRAYYRFRDKLDG
jgi:glycine/D-amino acid oxidase-like deaminating enzyme